MTYVVGDGSWAFEMVNGKWISGIALPIYLLDLYTRYIAINIYKGEPQYKPYRSTYEQLTSSLN